MNHLALFLFVISTVSASATPPTVRHYKSSREAFKGPDRTITWRAWKEASGGEFRVRTGDRYLGGQVWEHYLGFEQHRTSVKPIKLSTIRLGSEVVPEDVVIRPGLRYAIVKVTNDTMTAHKGVWRWTAQGVHQESLVLPARFRLAHARPERFASMRESKNTLSSQKPYVN